MAQAVAEPVVSGLTERELELRKRFVGASESAAILGVNPWANAADVYHEKVDGITKPVTKFMRLGTILEPYILDMAADEIEQGIHRVNRRRVHPSAHMQCTVDGFIKGQRAIVEAKKVNFWAFRKNEAEWGEPWTDQIPKQYLIQVQHALHVLTCSEGEPWDTAYLAVLIGDEDFRVYQIHRHPELGQMIEDAVEKFWNEHVEPCIPPAVAASIEVLAAIKRPVGVVKQGLPVELIKEYETAKAMKKQGEDDQDTAKQKILNFMGPECDSVITDGGSRATFKQVSRTSLNKDQLFQEHPELDGIYDKTSSSPRFSVKPGPDAK